MMSILTADGIQLPTAEELKTRIVQLDRDATAARHLLRLVMKLERQAQINGTPVRPADRLATRPDVRA